MERYLKDYTDEAHLHISLLRSRMSEQPPAINASLDAIQAALNGIIALGDSGKNPAYISSSLGSIDQNLISLGKRLTVVESRLLAKAKPGNGIINIGIKSTIIDKKS